ncbi:hypothetical protein HYPSUDRAFT_198799 [Hypholoma sublateritium FD-334 SS-4]|uniref:Uncharacterized protein n=1 Tax=Hypholoma sublateritium (strain FD-334 SS-4) TaxID=945553 RepID=A0A0D2LFU8_HYPSF|nr:hypothetical protein HYPSUDRAFT_198799 [Hypholoma sublateritium FD-334 SS-4]
MAITALAQAVPEMELRAVPPDLASWTEERTNALVSAETNASVQNAVDAFFSKNISIYVNGESFTRSDFVRDLQLSLIGRISSDAIYYSIIQVPTDPKDPVTAGWVGAFFNSRAYYSNRTQTHNISENILIQQDPSIPVPSPIDHDEIRVYFDRRRVMSINRVVTQDVV